jgi:CubicO group peptidase (beta-lactamase class C family)
MNFKKIYLLLFLFPGISTAYPGDDVAAKLESLMNRYDELGIFSGTVLLAKDDYVLYKKAFGYSDWEKQVSNSTETNFFLASITKAFTHTIIWQLEKEGKLSYDDPLDKYLDLYPDETGKKITIRMLLDMKAGLGNYLLDPNFFNDRARFKSVSDFLNIIKNEPLLFEPGTGKQYSNSGYVVLGGIIEKITGKSYEDNLKERIFEPLKMTGTYYYHPDIKYSNNSIGAVISFSGKKRNATGSSPTASPAGGIYSNPDDMLKFAEMLRQTNIFGNPAILAGGTPGWNSILGLYQDGYTLIVLSNFGKMAEEVESRVRAMIKGIQYPEPRLPPQMNFYETIKEKGIEYFKENLKEIFRQNFLEFNDSHLNMFGYDLMSEGELDLAIEVFKINAEYFPDIPNVYDSLGEAYMNKGEKQLAVENYEKVLQMMPGNQNAKQKLEELNANK